MAYQNSANNQDNNPAKMSISTNSITFFDHNSIMLKLGFLDESLSIGIWEPKVDPNTGKKTYPMEMRNNFILTAQRVEALYDLIMARIIPAVKENKEYNAGVFTSNKRDRIFEIHHKESIIYAYFHNNIDQDRHPQSTLVFEFPKTTAIQGYDPKTGDYNLEDMNSAFYLFVKALDSFLHDVSNSSTHSFRYANRFTTDKVFTYLKELALKLGVSIPTYSRQSNSGFNESYNTSTAGESVEIANLPTMETVNDIDSIV
jgi:hypothetical protein